MIVCIGDSITYGQGLEDFGRPWPMILAGKNGNKIISRGVPGDTTRLGLERFPRDVQGFCPAIVVIQFGHNDANRWESDKGVNRVSPAAYKANLVEMVDRCRAFGAIPLLCTLTPTTKSETLADDVARYDRALRRVADQEGVSVIDVRAAFESELGLPKLLLPDGLHLSQMGHEIYAETVAAALG